MFAATVFLKRKGLKKYLIRVECCLLFVEASREKASNQPHFALRAGLPKDKKMIMFVVRWLVGHLSYQWTVGWFKLMTACACTTSARIIPN